MQKQKLLYRFWVGGLVLCGLFTLLQFQLIAYHQLVDLEYNYLYNQPQIYVTYHHQESLRNYIRWSFGSQAKLATAIFQAESGLRCDSISKTGDYGLAQINHQAHPQYAISDLLDCQTNITIAAKIYHQQGNFNAWTTYRTGAYKQFYD